MRIAVDKINKMDPADYDKLVWHYQVKTLNQTGLRLVTAITRLQMSSYFPVNSCVIDLRNQKTLNYT